MQIDRGSRNGKAAPEERRNVPQDQVLELDGAARASLDDLLLRMRNRIALHARADPAAARLSVASCERLLCSAGMSVSFRKTVEALETERKHRAVEASPQELAESELAEFCRSGSFMESAAREERAFGARRASVFWKGRTYIDERQCCACGGSGRVACPRCGGGGRIRCSSCGGTGGNYSGMKSAFDACPACVGSGYVNCPSCWNGEVRCRQCGGSGYERRIVATPVIYLEKDILPSRHSVPIPDSFWRFASGGDFSLFQCDILNIEIEADTPAGRTRIRALRNLDGQSPDYIPGLENLLDSYADAEAKRLLEKLRKTRSPALPAVIGEILDASPRIRAVMNGEARGGREARRLRRALARRLGMLQMLGWLKAWLCAMALTIPVLPFWPWMRTASAWLARFLESERAAGLCAWLSVFAAWLAAGIIARNRSAGIAASLNLSGAKIKTPWTSGWMAILGLAIGLGTLAYASDSLGFRIWLDGHIQSLVRQIRIF